METKEELEQLEKDLENIEVKELSLRWKLILFLGTLAYILFSLWWDLFR